MVSLKDRLEAFPAAFTAQVVSVMQDAVQGLAENLAADFINAVSESTFEEFMAATGNGSKKVKRKSKGSKRAAAGKRGKARGARKAKKPARRAAPAKKPAASGRLQRRSNEEIEEVVGQVVKVLRRSPEGMRSEQIRDKLGLDAREIPRVLKVGVALGTVKVLSGQKRSTTYGVGRGKAKAKKSRKPAKKK